MTITFESKPTPERSIDRFYLIAKLFGINAVAPQRASVLEIGCSAGSNLLAQALLYPEAKFLGLDLDPEAINSANNKIKKLQLENCSFKTADISQFDFTGQQFDYIICHGLYSWVHPSLSECILNICSQQLQPNGIAYISYNTLPGWSTRAKLREQIIPKIDRATSPSEQSDSTLKLLQAIISKNAASVDYTEMLLAEEANNILSLAPGLIYHELLAEHSRAINFSDFCQALKSQGLQYLLEASLRRNVAKWSDRHSFDQQAWPEQLLQLEQQSDLRLNRAFRGSLVFSSKHTLQLPDLKQQLPNLQICSSLVALEKPDLFSTETTIFQSPNSGGIKVQSRLSKLILQHLSVAWPNHLAYQELLNLARISLENLSTDEISASENEIENLFWRGLIDLSFAPTSCLGFPKAKQSTPIFALSQLEALERNWVTNVKLEYVALNPFEQLFLQSHNTVSIDQILTFIKKNLEAGNLRLNLDGQETDSQKLAETDLLHLAEQMLQRLAESALLYGPV